MSKYENVKVSTKNPNEPITQKEYNNFWLGRVVFIHRIGNVEIIEYKEGQIGYVPSTESSYAINGINITMHSLDSAIVEVLIHKYNKDCGYNVGMYVCRMIGIPLK